MALVIDAARRRVRLDPRNADFFNDPYPAYAAIRDAAPAFFWEDYRFWCFARFADVSALLRDPRFGRTSVEPGPRDSKQHLEPFNALERHSMLELEPPEHTRLRNLVNRAFVSRRIEKLGAAVERLAHERIDTFAPKLSTDLVAEFASPVPVAVIADLIGVSTGPIAWSPCTSSV
jgi:unspecific monooxygenase